MEYAVESDQLSKNYGSMHALRGVNLHVPRGEIYGFVGRNGAGKTTCLRVLTGLQKPSEGSYQLFGIDYRNRREIRHQRNRIGAIIDSAAMYQDLGALENLRLQLLMMGVPDKSEAEYLLDLVGLSQAGKRPVRTYSLGMKQRLGIAMALAGSPDLLILDEPVNGLDPQGIIELRELIDRLRMQEGITFLISSHYLDELARLATWFGFLNHGKLIREVSREKMEQEQTEGESTEKPGQTHDQANSGTPAGQPGQTAKQDDEEFVLVAGFAGHESGITVYIECGKGSVPPDTMMTLSPINGNMIKTLVNSAVDGEVLETRAIHVLLHDPQGGIVTPQKPIRFRLYPSSWNYTSDRLVVLQILDDNTVTEVASSNDFRAIANSGIPFEAQANGIYVIVNVA